MMRWVAVAVVLLLAAACTTGRGRADADASIPPDAPGTDTATPACTPGVDCAVCTAGVSRCRVDALTPETCSPDGFGWVAEAPCDPEAGTVCSRGACLSLDQTVECLENDDRSYLGCEFWPVTLAHAHLSGSREVAFAVAVANPQVHAVVVRIDGGSLDAAMTFTVEPESLETVELPYVSSLADMSYRRMKESLLEPDAAYHVTASAPVTVTQFNPVTSIASADATMLLPTTALGSTYRVLTTQSQGTTVEHPGSFAVAAVADGTTVRVTPSAATVSGPVVPAMAAGSEHSFELGRGDVLQLIARDLDGDLTGTSISATQPVATFSSHLCANFPGTACDHLEEQTFPTTAWGRRYVVSSFGDSESVEFVVRILAGRDRTRVTFDPASVSAPVTLDDGEMFQLTTSGQFVVEGDQPILVAEFVSGRGAGGGEDPSLVYAVPVEQYRPHAIFLTAPEFDQSFANVVAPAGTIPVIDGSPVTVRGSPVGGSGMSVFRVPLTGGVHTMGTPGAAGENLGLVVYGFRPAGSYAYAAGLNQSVLNAPF